MPLTPRQIREQETFNRIVQEKKGAKTLIQTGLPSFCDYNLDLFSAAMRNIAIAKSTICEIGCGSGEITVWLAQQGARHVFGVDISDTSIHIAQQRAEQNNVQRAVTFLHAPGECTGIPSASCDYVFINVALHHLDIPQAVQEICRMLKPDGALVAIEPLILSRFGQRVRTSRLITRLFPIRQESHDERMLEKEDLQKIREAFHSVTLTSYRLFSPMLFKSKFLFHALARCIFWKKGTENKRQTLNATAQRIDKLLFYIIPPLRTLGRYSCIVAKKPK